LLDLVVGTSPLVARSLTLIPRLSRNGCWKWWVGESLCIKHGYVCVRRSKRHHAEDAAVALDTALAFATQNDNVWSYDVL